MDFRTIDSKGTLALRHKLGVSQGRFWKRQSGESRYETGRAIPRPVQLLMQLAYDADPVRVYERIRFKRRTR